MNSKSSTTNPTPQPNTTNPPALLPGDRRAETLAWIFSDLAILGIVISLWSIFLYLPFPDSTSPLEPIITVSGLIFALINVILFIIIKTTTLKTRRKVAIIPAFYTLSIIFNLVLTILAGLATIIMPTLAFLNFQYLLTHDGFMLIIPFLMIFQAIIAFIVALRRCIHVIKSRYDQAALRE